MCSECDNIKANPPDGAAVGLFTGVVPQFLMEKVPAMLGCDAGVFSPSSVSLEESNTHSDLKKSNRRSLGGKNHV